MEVYQLLASSFCECTALLLAVRACLPFHKSSPRWEHVLFLQVASMSVYQPSPAGATARTCRGLPGRPFGNDSRSWKWKVNVQRGTGTQATRERLKHIDQNSCPPS